MNEMFKSYSNHFSRCLSLKGEISNRRLLEYFIINYLVISGFASFVHGVYDGYTEISTPFNWFIFLAIYAMTTLGVVYKRVINN